MAERALGANRKNASKKSSWRIATTTIWLTVAGLVVGLAVYVWTAVNSNEAQQVRELRQTLDSLSDRGYQLQHKIDSINRLGVTNEEGASSPSSQVVEP